MWEIRLMHTNVEYLSSREAEALGDFQLSNMRYDDGNMVNKKVSTTVLQLYLIWTPAQILENVTQPAWEVFEMSQSDLHWEKHLKDLAKTSQRRSLSCDVFKMSQIHLKKNVFYMTT